MLLRPAGMRAPRDRILWACIYILHGVLKCCARDSPVRTMITKEDDTTD